MQADWRAATSSVRHRWPLGLFGFLRYFTDHVLYRFDWPVDWPQAMADEVFFVPREAPLAPFSLWCERQPGTAVEESTAPPAISGVRPSAKIETGR